jgi:hypothetical protein
MMNARDSLLEGHETVLLSALMNGSQTLPICADDFQSPPNRILFTRIIGLENRGLLAVTDALRQNGELAKVGGAGHITEITCLPHDAENLRYALDEVLSASRQRRAAEIGGKLQRGAIGPDEAVSSLNSLGRNGANLPQIEDASTLIAKPIILPDDVICGVVHRGGKLVLGGASKSYKTWLLIDLAVSVATGSEWFNGYPTKKGRVLYVNFELPASFFTKRIKTVCDERQLTIETGMLSLWNLRGRAGDWPQLQLQIASGKFALIIIDPSYKLLLGKDENRTGDISSLLNEMEILAVKTSAAVAFAAHYSKGNQSQKESIDRISGSGVWARDPDSILNFTRHEQSDCYTVEMTLRNHPPREPFVVRWEYPLFTVDTALDPARLKQAGRKEQYHAKDVLALIDEPMSATEIVKAAYEERNIPRRRVFELLADLKASGLLKQPERRGKYEPV